MLRPPEALVRGAQARRLAACHVHMICDMSVLGNLRTQMSVRVTCDMSSRRKRKLLQADPSASTDFAVSINQAFPAISSSTARRSATPAGGGSVERPSDDRRRLRREVFPVPSPSTASTSLNGTPDTRNIPLPGGDDVFTPSEVQDSVTMGGDASAEPEEENMMRAKRYMTSVSTLWRTYHSESTDSI